MNTPSLDDISLRAYYLWEARGRPEGEASAVECWVQAERELREGKSDPLAMERDEQGREDGDHSDASTNERNGADHPEARITNLDRSLPADERTRARNARQASGDKNSQSPFGDRPGRESFLVVLNRAHLRIYDVNQLIPAFVSGFDLPQGARDYTDNDTDHAGRFPGSHGTSPGGSIDERLSMRDEQLRRLAKESATRIQVFLQQHPRARWHFAAGPALHKAVLDQLPPSLHTQLGQTVMKDLVNLPLPELIEHFELHTV